MASYPEEQIYIPLNINNNHRRQQNKKEALLQWNTNGIKNKYSELRFLTGEYNPFCICIQETHLKANNNYENPKFQIYRKEPIIRSEDRARGGVLTMIRNDISQKSISINTNLQAIAVRVNYPQEMTIVNLYLPDQSWTEPEIRNLMEQITAPMLICGDFNCHNTLWGSNNSDQKGEILEDIMADFNMICMNNGSSTHIVARTGGFSTVDLTFGSPCLAGTWSWHTLSDPHQSDHFPIKVFSNMKENSITLTNKWKLKDADWKKFQNTLKIPFLTENIDEDVKNFSNMILNAAEISIRKTKGVQKINPVPWWTKECYIAIRKKKNALNRYKRYPSIENLIEFKKYRAAERKLKRVQQNQSWRNYTNTIGNTTTSSEVWKRISAMMGKSREQKIVLQGTNNTTVSNHIDVANILAEHYEKISSNENYSLEFQQIKTMEETREIIFEPNDNLIYNLPLQMRELEKALSESKDTSPGSDNIPYQFVKNLSSNAKYLLLNLYNNLWSKGIYPDAWKNALIIPIHKPGKDPKLPSSYRPISLTCCLGKLFERIINERLNWWLNSQSFINKNQLGYKKGHSAIDLLVRLEEILQNCFLNREHAIAVFFDLEKAYDMTWRYNIIRNMHQWGIQGKMGNFMKNFLQNRTFKVKYNNTESNGKIQENGTPQGSIISTTAFLIAKNKITDGISPGTSCLEYVDDLVIIRTGSDLLEIAETIQEDINIIVQNADQTGFSLSKEKTVCMHFCRLRKDHLEPTLMNKNEPIPYKDEVKFLGLFWDKKLNWKSHINYLITKTKKSMQVIRTLSHLTWGAENETLKNVIEAILISKIEYGCEVYGSARKTRLLPLERLENLAARLSCGGFRTSPIYSIHKINGTFPPKLRRNKKILEYYLKIKTNINHLLYESFNDESRLVEYESSQTRTKHLKIRANEFLQRIRFNTNVIHNFNNTEFPWWSFIKIKLDLRLTNLKKNATPPDVFLKNYFEWVDYYKSWFKIFTDGSKTVAGVGCAIFADPDIQNWSLSHDSSVYTAEQIAILKAVNYCNFIENKEILICTDSSSTLAALKHTKITDSFNMEIMKNYDMVSRAGKKIILAWIPGHVGIQGNETADKAAKDATRLDSPNFNEISRRDQQIQIKKTFQMLWEYEWERENTQLSRISLVNQYKPHQRKELSVINRIAIGHTRLTHGHLLIGERPPCCPLCGIQQVSVKHIVETCCVTVNYRLKNKINGKSLEDIFIEGKQQQLIQFLKDIKLYQEI